MKIVRSKMILFSSLSCCLVSAQADVMKTDEKTVRRVFPDESSFANDTEYKKKFEEIKAQLEELRKTSENAQNTLKFANGNQVVSTQQTPPKNSDIEENNDSFFEDDEEKFLKTKKIEKQRPKFVTTAKINSQSFYPQQKTQPASGVQIFNVSTLARDEADSTMTVLPTGSFVSAKILSGVEANQHEPYPVLLQLSYAFTGPNRTKINLSNCFMIAKARANISTERVIMETDTLSCVKQNGEHYKITARGYTAGEDSTFGSTGTFISKQGQVLLAAVLANIAKNAGDALATAQTTTDVVAGNAGAPASATNVTGQKMAYVGGKSVVDAGAMIAQWYLDYARQLVPSIGIGSGQTVHVIMLDTIRVPILEDE